MKKEDLMLNEELFELLNSSFYSYEISNDFLHIHTNNNHYVGILLKCIYDIASNEYTFEINCSGGCVTIFRNFSNLYSALF